MIKLLGTCVLAGIAGAMFTGIIADALGVSVVIASSVAGALLVVIVGLLIARERGRDEEAR